MQHLYQWQKNCRQTFAMACCKGVEVQCKATAPVDFCSETGGCCSGLSCKFVGAEGGVLAEAEAVCVDPCTATCICTCDPQGVEKTGVSVVLPNGKQIPAEILAQNLLKKV